VILLHTLPASLNAVPSLLGLVASLLVDPFEQQSISDGKHLEKNIFGSQIYEMVNSNQ
jgi:hypothetical protein